MEPPHAKLFQYGSAYFASLAVFAAADLGVADAIAAGAHTADEVAARSGTHPRMTYRLLRALAGLGLAVEDAGSRFELTPSGELLRSDVPGSLRDLIRMQAEHFAAWIRLPDSVRTGQVAFELAFEKPVFDWMAEHPESARIFDNAMAGATTRLGALVAGAFDFSGVSTVVDVGGGIGVLLAELLTARPGLRGVLADQAPVVERGRAYLGARGLLERVELRPTDFFAAVPAGGDLYLMKSILHDWADEQAIAILKNVRKVGARLLLCEWVMPAPGEPLDGRAPLFDLNMMVMTGGGERTVAEWRALLQAGGWALEGVTPLPSGSSLISARGA